MWCEDTMPLPAHGRQGLGLGAGPQPQRHLDYDLGRDPRPESPGQMFPALLAPRHQVT